SGSVRGFGADCGTGAAATGARCGAVAAFDALAGAALAAAPGPEMTATTAPTFATSPTWKRISESVPLVVEGTSIDVLSVSISNRLSPGFTASPADLNHFTILPSATVSPSCGIRTSIVLPAFFFSSPPPLRGRPTTRSVVGRGVSGKARHYRKSTPPPQPSPSRGEGARLRSSLLIAVSPAH